MAKQKKHKSEPRQKIEFWLRKTKDEELWLMELVDYLKSQRIFARVIRDGLRLMWDLKNKNVDVLLELFPDIAERLEIKLTPPPPTPDLDELQRKLDRMEKLLLERGGENITPAPPSYPLLKPSGLQPLSGAGRVMSLPTFDDDDDGETLVLKKNTNTDASMNFLKQLQGFISTAD